MSYSRQTTTVICQDSGYDYDFTCDQSVLLDFQCFVCRLTARNPQQVNCCGKILCTSCLDRWRKSCNQLSHGKCPHCKQKITFFEDKKSHQKIISLSVRCSFTTHGCNWVGELKTFESTHFHSCTYQVKPCLECGEQIPKQKMKYHTTDECPMRQIKCQYCPCRDTYKFVNEEHKNECRYWPVDCPSGCGADIPRCHVEQHREICEFQLVQCRYNVNGCQVMVKRGELKDHEKECARKLPESTLLTRQQKVTKENSEKGTVAPIMLQLPELKEKEAVWESQPFYCYEGGYRVCLRVHTNGCREYEGEYLACYIHLHSGHFDDTLPWPFQGVFRVSLRNQVMDGNHHLKEIKFLTCQCAAFNNQPDTQVDDINSIGIGDPQFIKLNNLINTSKNVEYLKNDRLVFCVEYEPPKQQPYNCFQLFR